jgi:CO/xanthine dehydrogenase Mo-binding subunit
MKKSMRYVGKSITRVDAAEKIRGQARYIDDYCFPGMLWGYTVRSICQRAQLRQICFPELPPSVTILTAKNIPGQNYIAFINDDQPVLAEHIVQYVGEPIALLAGPDLDQLRQLADAVQINYELLEPIDTMDDALSGKQQPIFNQDNLFREYAYLKGEPDRYIQDKVNVFTGTYRTGYQEHVYLEPQGVIAIPLDQGIKVLGSFQCPFYVRKGVAPALNLSEEQVIIEQVVTGGGFGGKEEFPSLLAAHAALLAQRTRQAVKMIYDRQEDIQVTTKRHPSKTIHNIAFDRNQYLTAMDIDFCIDGGAHSTLSGVVLARGALSAPGVYRCPNIRLRARAIATNQVPSGAFRGFGAPQAFFAIEQQMNHAAYHLKVDPYSLRKKNIFHRGDRNATGQLLVESFGLEKVLDTVALRTDFVSKYREYNGQNRNAMTLKGIGISAFLHGCGFTGKGEELIKATATVEYSRSAGALIKVAVVDMGQGMATVIRQIAAEALNLSLNRVNLAPANTSIVPNSGPTVASRTTTIVGGLVYECCQELRQMAGLEQHEITFDDYARNHLDSYQVLTATRTYKVPEKVRWDEENFIGDAYPIFAWAAAVVEIEINPLTYEVNVRKVTAAHDVGKAINPALVEGQIQGGTLQGLGWAGMEVLTTTGGRFNQTNLTDYIIPSVLDVPEIDAIIVEESYPRGPYGAKGVGEQPLVGIPPAYVGAVENALGVEFYEIPLTPEKIFEVVQKTAK